MTVLVSLGVVLLFNFGTEWLIIIPIVFLLFGASRLPQLAKSLGQTRKAFKDGMREAEEEDRAEQEERMRAINVRGTSTPQQIAQPQVTQMSDEDLLAEMQRRVAAKQQ